MDGDAPDASDYEEDVSDGYNPVDSTASPSVSQPLDNLLNPDIDAKLETAWHMPGPLVFVMDKREFKKGLAGGVATPRFSNGGGDLRSLPT
ncbi:peptidase M14, partial [Pseudoalteromonas sp. S1649]